jgi:hypothetical protein
LARKNEEASELAQGQRSDERLRRVIAGNEISDGLSISRRSIRTVGVLLAVLGYALGTYGGWLTRQLIRLVAQQPARLDYECQG